MHVLFYLQLPQLIVHFHLKGNVNIFSYYFERLLTMMLLAGMVSIKTKQNKTNNFIAVQCSICNSFSKKNPQTLIT